MVIMMTIVVTHAKPPVKQVKAILRLLLQTSVELPAGGVLTPGRFLQLGLDLGGAGGFESLHYLLENAFDDNGDLSFSFLREVCRLLCFFSNGKRGQWVVVPSLVG